MSCRRYDARRKSPWRTYHAAPSPSSSPTSQAAPRWERDRQAMAQAVERHLALLNAAIPKHGGVHFKTVRDTVQEA